MNPELVTWTKFFIGIGLITYPIIFVIVLHNASEEKTAGLRHIFGAALVITLGVEVVATGLKLLSNL